MRLGCTTAAYDTKFGPIVFRDGDLDHDFSLMRRYGMSAADMFVKKVPDSTLREYRRKLEAYEIRLATYIAIFLGENGVTLTEKDPGKRLRNLDLIREQLDAARFLNARGMAMGFIRGGYDAEKEKKEDAMKRMIEGLHVIGEYAASIGTKVLLEPINRYEINTVNTGIEAADLIRENQLEGVGLLLDCFHMNIEDRSFGETIRYANELVVNIHISDSNRYAPGEGHLPLGEVMQALLDIHFDGCAVLEAYSDQPEKSLQMTAKEMERLQQQLHFLFDT